MKGGEGGDRGEKEVQPYELNSLIAPSLEATIIYAMRKKLPIHCGELALFASCKQNHDLEELHNARGNGVITYEVRAVNLKPVLLVRFPSDSTN